MPESLVATEAFRRWLLRSVILQAFALGLSAGASTWQIGRLRDNARLGQHTDQMIGRLHLPEKYQIDMEPGLRGCLEGEPQRALRTQRKHGKDTWRE